MPATRSYFYFGFLYDLCYQIGFGNYFVADKNSSFHFTNSTAYWIHQFHLENERVTWNNLVLEFTVVDFEKIGIVIMIRIIGNSEYASRLSQGFYLQYTRHHTIPRKMT